MLMKTVLEGGDMATAVASARETSADLWCAQLDGMKGESHQRGIKWVEGAHHIADRLL
jgi:hypothetical protein